MATDYDAPRRTEDSDIAQDSLEELKARRSDKQSSSIDQDEAEVFESLELPGADLSNEELKVQSVPQQTDEFTCSNCFLVRHASQLASQEGNLKYCTECAA